MLTWAETAAQAVNKTQDEFNRAVRQAYSNGLRVEVKIVIVEDNIPTADRGLAPGAVPAALTPPSRSPAMTDTPNEPLLPPLGQMRNATREEAAAADAVLRSQLRPITCKACGAKMGATSVPPNAAPPAPARPRSPEFRERLGRRVREVWIEWACEQPNPKSHWLWPWEELDEPDREVDRRIGEELYALGMVETLQAQCRETEATAGQRSPEGLALVELAKAWVAARDVRPDDLSKAYVRFDWAIRDCLKTFNTTLDLARFPVETEAIVERQAEQLRQTIAADVHDATDYAARAAALQQRIDQLEAELKHATFAFGRWGQHDSGCDARSRRERSACDCGLDMALADIEPAASQQGGT